MSKVAIQGDMWEASCHLPPEQQKAFIFALVQYGMDGTEPDADEPWYMAWVCCRDRVAMSAERSRKGQDAANRQWANKKPSRQSAKGDEAGSQNTQQGSDEKPILDTHNGSGSQPILGSADAEMSRDEMRGEEILSGEPDDLDHFDDAVKAVADNVISRLNDLTHQSFRSRSKKALRPIAARLREGYSEADLVCVVENQCRLWLRDQRMRVYLRPETLFGPKCEGYLNAAKMSSGGVSNADAAAYDAGISLVAY
ncbi:hypothetical protein HGI81_05530 [Olsenella sp. KGMB02461]|nr:hypothetical protein [Olsenella sp. KGMB02461]